LLHLTLEFRLLLVWIIRINNKFIGGFKDNFKGDFRKNWDFIGPWRTINDNCLVVTGSDEGGITKVGAFWENYIYSFKAKIINSCIGVIVRAQDLNNYYMFQIGKDKIVPHRRAAVPVVAQEPGENEVNIKVGYRIGWNIINEKTVTHGMDLNNWFTCSITTKGESVLLKIDGEIVFQEESFLKIPYGKVGLRNWDEEKALIKDVKVSFNI